MTSQISFGFFRLGGIGLLIGDVLGRLIGTMYFGYNNISKQDPAYHHINWPRLLIVLKRYLSFSTTLTLASLLNILPVSLPTILMTTFFGPKTGGLYAVAQLVLSAPVNVCHQVVGNVFVSEFSKLLVHYPGNIIKFMVKTTLGLSFLSLPVLLISFWGPPLFAFFFGEVWRESGVYGQILTFYALGAIIGGTLYPTLTLLKRQNWQLGWSASRCFMVIMVMFVMHQWGMSSKYIVMAYSLTMCFFSVFHLCLSLISARSLSKSI
jgi:O-antigen/teichoic acid export membrane protein